MNRRLYHGAMRYGSLILFVVFIIAAFTAFVTFYINYAQTIEYLSESAYLDSYWPLIPSVFIRSFVEALVSAALLFLGSALLYRADKWLEAAE